MICILSLSPLQLAPQTIEHKPGDEIGGWIIATDVHDARRQAEAAFDNALAHCLYGMEFPKPGKTVLPTGHVMLVS